MSSIRDLLFHGRPSEALDAYQTLSKPAPEDDRFGGVALLRLGLLHGSRDLLLRSFHRGCNAAAIDLSTVYQYLQQYDLAHDVLQKNWNS